jgi:holo-ACP synthase / triphosphoribosyl-dephospho-CoA synthase
MNERLDARENKHILIQEMLETNPIVIAIGANIPGSDKNISEAHLLVRLFLHVIQDLFSCQDIKSYPSVDGPITLVSLLKCDVLILKKQLIQIEETHPLGRLIDLDLYVKERAFSISRKELNLPSRTCMICGLEVHVCRRLGKHSEYELLSYIQHEVEHYITTIISAMIEDSMNTELDLEHKFGLITKTSKGSHDDMDYELMTKAKDVLIPYFIKIFLLGYHATNLDTLLITSRPLGIEAELKMLETTQGVNCYKGLIFVLGLVLLSTGYVISHQEPFEAIFKHIRFMTKPVLNELKEGSLTHGKHMYQAYGSLGVRGEAHMGFPSISHALTLLEQEPLSDGLIRHVLKEIALKIDDTVLLHRAGSMEQAIFFKDMLKHSDVRDESVAQKVTSYAISKRLSLGGSADCLVASLFLHMVKSWIL